MVAETGIGKGSKISLFRDGKALELSITLANADSAPKQRQKVERGGSRQDGEADLLGLIVEDSDQGNGVVVIDAVRGGAAAESGIKRGDVIVSINRTQTTNTSEYSKILQRAGRNGSLTILVRRGDASIYFALRIK
jgi:S1-C subfamily serine protease